MVSPLSNLRSLLPKNNYYSLSSVVKNFSFPRGFTGIKGSAFKPKVPIVIPINPNNRTTWDLLVNLRSKISSNSLNKEDFDNALQSALQKNDTTTAKEIVMTQLGVKKGLPNIEVFNKILHGLAFEKNWDAMNSIRSIIRRNKIPFTTDTYYAIIHSFRLRHDFNSMTNVFEAMKKEKVEPNSDIYKEFLEEYIHRAPHKSRKRDLNELLNHLYATNFPFPQDFLELAIKACYQFSEFPQIGKLWNTIKSMNFKPSLESYNYRLSTAWNGKQFKVALHLFEEMKKNGISPSTETYEILLRIRSATKNKEDISIFVDSMLNEMKEKKVTIDTSIYDAVIQCYSRKAHFDKAIEYIKFMKENKIPFSPQTPCAIIPSIRKQFILDYHLGRKTAILLRRVRHMRDKKGTRYQPILNPVDEKALMDILDLLPKYKQASSPLKKRPNKSPASSQETPKEK